MDEPTKKPDPLTPRQRAERMLVSQGWAPGRLPSFTDEMQKSLADLCGEDGVLVEGAREKFQPIKDDYYAHMAKLKAAVDEPDVIEQMAATLKQHLLGDAKVGEE